MRQQGKVMLHPVGVGHVVRATALSFLLLHLCGVLPALATSSGSAGAGGSVVDNTRPRTDTTGAIVNAHQGGIVWHEPDRRYYWVGCAWVPCKEGPTGCNFTHIHANSTWGDCGFVRIASPAFTCATAN